MAPTQTKLATQQNSYRYLFPTCQKSYATQASWKQPLRILVEIWRNTTQFGEYKMVDAYATTADTRSTHRAVANVVTVTRNGLKQGLVVPMKSLSGRTLYNPSLHKLTIANKEISF